MAGAGIAGAEEPDPDRECECELEEPGEMVIRTESGLSFLPVPVPVALPLRQYEDGGAGLRRGEVRGAVVGEEA